LIFADGTSGGGGGVPAYAFAAILVDVEGTQYFGGYFVCRP